MLFLDISNIALMFPFNWGKLVSMLVCICSLEKNWKFVYWWLLISFYYSISTKTLHRSTVIALTKVDD
jgi:hypothetical protein